MRTRCVALLALFALAAVPPARAAEDKTKAPTLIVRVQSLDGLIADARYLAAQAGREEEARQAEGFLKGLTGEKGVEGIDTRRPMGLYGTVAPNPAESEVVLMLPVADEAAFLDMLKRLNMKPRRGDDGVHEVQVAKVRVPFYFRFANKYLYATARDKAAIDPKRLLAPAAVLPAAEIGLASATVNFETVPEQIRDMVLGQVELKLGNLKEKRDNETKAQHALREKIVDEVALTLKSLLNEGGSLTVRAAIDQKAGEVSASLSLSPRAGTDLAKRIQALAAVRSTAAGLIGEDSAASARLTIDLPEEVRKAVGPAVEDAFTKALKGVENETGRELLARYFKAILPTVKEGTFDTAVDLRGPSDKKLYTAVGAIRVKDGQEVEKAIRATVEKLPQKDREKVTLDADKAGGVAIHRLNVAKDLKEQDRKTFGENPIYFAVRDDAVLYAMGDKGLDGLKASAAVRPKGGPIVHLEMALAHVAPLMARDQKHAPEAARVAFEKDRTGDKVYLSVEGGKALQLRAGLKGGVIRFFSELERLEKKDQGE